MQRTLIQFLVLVFGFGTLALAQPDSNSAKTASVSGRVIRNGAPLSDVSVFAKRANQYGGWDQPGVSVKTDSNGQYLFSGLNAGSYILTVRSIEDLLVVEGSPHAVSGSGKTVVLRAGETITGINFALVKGGVISGTIVDENDKPVRIGITLLHFVGKLPDGRRTEFSPSHWYNINYTDAQGRYRLTGIPAGKYLVRVGIDAATAPTQGKFYPHTFAPGTTDEASAQIIEVKESGEVPGVNIKLNPPEPLYTAKGRIVDSTTGLPMTGVRIYYAALFSSGDPIRLLNNTRERTNAQGEFQLLGLRPGKYVTCLRAEDAPDFYSEWTHFEVAESDVKELEINAKLGASISGVVAIEGSKSPTLPPDRSNLVIVYSDDSDQLPTPRGKLPQTNPDGSFRLTGLKPGNIRLHVNNTNWAAPRVHLFRTERNDQLLSDGMISVRSGEEVANVRLVVGSGTGSVRGHVTFTGGALPASETWYIELLKMNGDRVQDRRPGTVDASGRFWVGGLLPGEYRVSIFVPGTIRLSQAVRQRLWEAHSITVTADVETPVALTYDLSEEKK